MIDKKLFFETINSILISFNYEFNKVEDLKVYCANCYMIFEDKQITPEQLLKGAKYMMLNFKKEDIKGRPAPLDLLEKIGLYKHLTIEEEAGTQFDKVIEVVKYVKREEEQNFNQTTIQVLSCYYENGIDTIRYLLDDPFNDNKTPIQWLRKEFINYYIDKKNSTQTDNLLIENSKSKEVNNVIENLSQKLIKKVY